LAENNHITSIGNVMYTNYNLWLILASFILLLAMVGSIVLVMKTHSSTRSSNTTNINGRKHTS
jgi:NADH:ubiquinone oxidoreductase subunit 6 (subunit J)